MTQQENDAEWKIYEQSIENFIHGIAQNMTLYGITPSVGRLYGVLYFSDDPMTLDDMKEALEMSKTSMSTGIRTLSDMRMVESTFRRGIRKDLYQSDEDWYKSFTSLFGNRWRQYTETNIEDAEETIKRLEKLHDQTEDVLLKEKINSDFERLKYAKNYYKWLLRFIQVIETGKIFEYIPKEDDN